MAGEPSQLKNLEVELALNPNDLIELTEGVNVSAHPVRRTLPFIQVAYNVQRLGFKVPDAPTISMIYKENRPTEEQFTSTIWSPQGESVLVAHGLEITEDGILRLQSEEGKDYPKSFLFKSPKLTAYEIYKLPDLLRDYLPLLKFILGKDIFDGDRLLTPFDTDVNTATIQYIGEGTPGDLVVVRGVNNNRLTMSLYPIEDRPRSPISFRFARYVELPQEADRHEIGPSWEAEPAAGPPFVEETTRHIPLGQHLEEAIGGERIPQNKVVRTSVIGKLSLITGIGLLAESLFLAYDVAPFTPKIEFSPVRDYLTQFYEWNLASDRSTHIFNSQVVAIAVAATPLLGYLSELAYRVGRRAISGGDNAMRPRQASGEAVQTQLAVRTAGYPAIPGLSDPVFDRLVTELANKMTPEDMESAYMEAYSNRFGKLHGRLATRKELAGAYAIGAMLAKVDDRQHLQVPEIPDFSPNYLNTLQFLGLAPEDQKIQENVLELRKKMRELFRPLLDKVYLREVENAWGLTRDLGTAVQYAEALRENGALGPELKNYRPSVPWSFYVRHKAAQLMLK